MTWAKAGGLKSDVPIEFPPHQDMTQSLLDAIRIIHAHHGGRFHERVFHALDTLFPDSRYALELFARDGSYSIESNLPFDACPQPDILARTAELVRTQSPMYAKLADGETSPMRLSDFITLRQLRRTDLYHEIFTQIGIRHQIGIPIQSKVVLGGLTINRQGRDYRVEDVSLAAILAPQIATAFEVAIMLRKLAPEMRLQEELDHTHLRRLGLSRREAEVMVWLVEAKRDAEIAVILGCSVRTVQQHVRAILGKLRVENRTAAVAHAVRSTSPVPINRFP